MHMIETINKLIRTLGIWCKSLDAKPTPEEIVMDGFAAG